MRSILAVALLLVVSGACGGQPQRTGTWQARLRQELPLLGHRNWILIVDSAYPLQTTPGLETIATAQPQLTVVHDVLEELAHSPHVRPVVFVDRELEYVPSADYPTVVSYRNQLLQALKPYPISPLLHEELLRRIAEESKTYKVLVLKTTMTIPYTSVFVRLDCKYLGAEGEQRIRAAMKAAGVP